MHKRIQSQFRASEITVLIDTFKDAQKCVRWLKKELEKENGTIANIAFKTIGECRGLEFPVLLTISTNGSNNGLALAIPISTRALDAWTWTRVTAALFIIQMEKQYSTVTQGLKDCIKKQVAIQSEDQEEIKYNILKRLYFFLQTPLFWYIVLVLLMGNVCRDSWLRPYSLDFFYLFMFYVFMVFLPFIFIYLIFFK